MEFYDGSTDLGPGSYNVYSSTPLGLGVYEGSQWTLTLGPWSPALGSHTITAVYSGDNNFAGGQSSTTLNNVGQQLFIPGVGVNNFGQISGGGGIAIVSGSVGNLDGAAFTVTVDWGDGEDGQADAENFSFAAGETNFNVSHYYLAKTSTGATTTPSGYEDLGFTASETFAIGLTVTSADGRTAATSPDNAPSVTLTDSGPSVYVVETSREPSEEWMEDGGNFRAVANDPGNPAASFSYEWVSGWPEDLVDLGELDTAAIDAATYSGMVSSGQGGVIVTSSDGAATYWAGEGWWRTPSATTEPTATIAETDTNQTVSAGQTATFDINVNWAGSDASTLTVYYQTVDGTSNGTGTVGAVSGTDYQLVSRNGLPLDGMQCLVIGCPQSGGSEQTVAPVTVITFGGNYDGATKTFSVQLLTPASDGPGFVAQTGTGGSATATIQDPQIGIYFTDAENLSPANITNLEPVNVQLGEFVTLTAMANGTRVAANWVLPGNGAVIENYCPSENAGSGLIPLGQTVNGSQVVSDEATITFEWVGACGGSVSATPVGASGPSATASASFSVQAPQGVTVTATPTPVLSGPLLRLAAAGTKFLWDGGTLVYSPPGAGCVVLQMVPLAWNATVPADPSWAYCFAQTEVVANRTFTAPSGVPGVGWDTWTAYGPTIGLDGNFPFLNKTFTPPTFVWGDHPQTLIYVGGTSSLDIQFTTYLMCEPVNPTTGASLGVWAPLADLTWKYKISATLTAGSLLAFKNGTTWGSVLVGSAWPQMQAGVPCSFQPTTTYPQWTADVPSPSPVVNLRTGEVVNRNSQATQPLAPVGAVAAAATFPTSGGASDADIGRTGYLAFAPADPAAGSSPDGLIPLAGLAPGYNVLDAWSGGDGPPALTCSWGSVLVVDRWWQM